MNRVFLLLLMLLLACSDSPCPDGTSRVSGHCGPVLATGGDASVDAGMTGGVQVTGGMTGSGGSGGMQTGGVSGTGGMQTGGGNALPCDGACKGATPVCEKSSNTCVACTNSDSGSCGDQVCSNNSCVDCNVKSDCSGATPACDAATHTCVACVDKSTCKDVAGLPECSSAHECVECTDDTQCGSEFCVANQCVPCRDSADCTDPTAAHCGTSHTCEGCVSNEDCMDIVGTKVCNASDQTCVECTGTDYVTACGKNVSDEQQVCDSLNHTCSTATEHSASPCQPCITDAQCQTGQLCVMQTFGTPAEEVGYFCFWSKSSALGPNGDCNAVVPYSGITADAESIDSVVDNICRLRASTCLGIADYTQESCADPMTGDPDDYVCGFHHSQEETSSIDVDAYCVDMDPTSGVTWTCSPRCLGSSDCKSSVACLSLNGDDFCDPNP